MQLDLLKSCCDSLAKAKEVNEILQSRSEEEETYFKDVVIFLTNAIEVGFKLIVRNFDEKLVFKSVEFYKTFQEQGFDYVNGRKVETINIHKALKIAKNNLEANQRPSDELVELCKYIYNIRNYITHFQFIAKNDDLDVIYEKIDELLKSIKEYFIKVIPEFDTTLDTTNLAPYSGMDYLNDMGQYAAESSLER
ncbi:hypothetical protein [Listeria booriae]|uniref:hypothetical protein n=1 Tax=Listeria booriae TaxID=1552123 RepID=UPI00162A54B3|nr:hypothetical protein [Listeria booriae]MBC2179666.1 hypothetical protein [Listeria booriae]MBC6300506.1 hypothetical protein [Listeria booriae]